MTPNFCRIVREFRNKLFVQFVMHVRILSLLRMFVGLLEDAIANLRPCSVGIDRIMYPPRG